MDSAGASSSPIKSNKILLSSDNKSHFSGEVLEAPDQNPWSSKTPEKPAHPPRRALNSLQTLRSVNQIREAVKRLRKSDLKPSVSSDGASTGIRDSKRKPLKSLPEKYEMLNKFFSSLGSSIRLLGLKGSRSTFTNISRQVEILTDRSFGYRQLAQLKFILPEAIEMKKILVRDDRTCCMKPDLHITLNFCIVRTDENLTSDSANILMNKLFRSRLSSFCISNPEVDEVPEEQLPEPFNRSIRSSSSHVIQNPDLDLVHDNTYSTHEQQPIAASHIPQSFKRRFSKQVSKEVKIESMVLTPETRVDHVQTPIKGVSCIDETPIKQISTPFSSTPTQSARPPVRCFMTPDEKSTMCYSKLTRRSLPFDTPVKNKTPFVNDDNDDDDISDILSHDLLSSIKQKELKAIEEKNPDISQAKWRKQMIAKLPKLFDTLLFFFQSTKQIVITKQELVNMIISNGLDVVDPKEVDEQLRLLLELAPEWIYEKIASSGDMLLRVNKISSPESIRARLLEAN